MVRSYFSRKREARPLARLKNILRPYKLMRGRGWREPAIPGTRQPAATNRVLGLTLRVTWGLLLRHPPDRRFQPAAETRNAFQRVCERLQTVTSFNVFPVLAVRFNARRPGRLSSCLISGELVMMFVRDASLAGRVLVWPDGEPWRLMPIDRLG